ncbi:MAG: dUTP diphosphatase [Acidobacteriota bacterium]
MPQNSETPDHLLIQFKRLHPDAQLPTRGSAAAAGADLHCLAAFTLHPGERQAVATGLAVAIPAGWYGRVAPRSGLAAKHGVDTLAGVIDSDYRGEVRVLLVNLGQEPVRFAAGDRIAQLIIERAAECSYQWAEDLADTERAAGGFGSTGR